MRYFYTDSLAAAWMAKQFGMRFFIDPYGSGRREIIDTQLLHIANDTFPPEDKYFIHPESLHLLIPGEGDIVNTVASRFVDNPDARIIQRNGIALMWPESGDA